MVAEEASGQALLCEVGVGTLEAVLAVVLYGGHEAASARARKRRERCRAYTDALLMLLATLASIFLGQPWVCRLALQLRRRMERGGRA